MTSPENPPSDESIRAGHELKDVNIRVILWLMAGITVTAVVVQIALGYFTLGLEATAKQNDPIASPLAAERQLPPAPRLQSTPNQDYAEFRAREDARLNSYGWVDEKSKIVHIPVDRAIDLVLERSFNPEPSVTADKPK